MVSIQEIFNRIAENKKKQKEIKSAIREALQGTPEYVDIVDKLKALREKKKQIENRVKEEYNSEFTKLDDMKIDLASDQELLNDAAMSQIMKGETVTVTDEYNNNYEPVFSVRFKKN